MKLLQQHIEISKNGNYSITLLTLSKDEDVVDTQIHCIAEIKDKWRKCVGTTQGACNEECAPFYKRIDWACECGADKVKLPHSHWCPKFKEYR